MSSSWLKFLFLLVSIHLISSTTAQNLFPNARCSNTVGNFTTNSTYQSQLDSIFSSITSTNSIYYGFFNASTSTNQNSDAPYVIGLCRGDLQTEACRTCLNTSAYDLRQLCPNQKEALVYNDNCTLRYSNSSLLSKVVTTPDYMLYNVNNVSNPDSFNQALEGLLSSLRSMAASSGSVRKFAEGNTTAVVFSPIYAFVQCTPDLSEQQCSDCLVQIVSRMDQCCSGKRGGRIMSPSCSFRFESDRFLDSVEALPSTPPAASPSPEDTASTSPPGSKGSDTNRTIILIVIPVIIVAVLIVVIVFFLKRKRKPLPMVETYEAVEEIDSVEFVQFDLATIEAATHGFSDDNKLGQGGFGPVYKGMLSNGQEIAVKRLSRNSGQGALEFKNEVKLLARLQHRNLVRLQGFCLDGTEKLLIYEFVTNSSLDHFIFDPIKRQLLNWDIRYKIIIGIARGLLYLHEDSRLRIIHRDLKASNILLDSEMNPKISDFGMAKLFAIDQTQADTSRIVGTYGYMAPEYAMHGNFSLKSDVFSFGVLVLEIVSGQRNNCFHHGETVEDLLSYAWRNWREGSLTNVIDPILDSGSRVEMARCIHIGLLCVQENAANRPTMASVVLMLNSYSTTLAIPSQPAFFMHTNTESDMSTTQEYTSKESDTRQSNNKMGNMSKNDVSITELYPR